MTFLKDLLTKIASLISAFWAGYIVGGLSEELEGKKEEVRSHENRERIEDNIIKLSPSERRMRLGKWVRGVEADPPDAA